LEAVARAGIIALLWDTCKASAAQKAVVAFVDWMNQNLLAGKLTGTEADRSQLISIMFAGVGLSVPPTTNMGPDFGIGFFDPNSTNNTLVKNQNNTALVQLEPGSFDEPTTIVIARNPDNFELTDFDGTQLPPFFDYNAINASGNHILEDGKTAIVGFCLLDPDYDYSGNIRIGHNPVQINEGVPSGLPVFEILDPVNLAEEELALDCGKLVPNIPPPVIGGFGGGLPDLASTAWRAAKYYLGPVAENLFLPQALSASTLGTLPPPGGRASSLSPFGIVKLPNNTTINFDVGPDGETPVANGTEVSSLYTSMGIIFQHAGTAATCGTTVYANSDQPEGFGSPPNVVSLCGATTASDISENTFGLIQADLTAPAERVCIDADPVIDNNPDVLHSARLDAYDAAGVLIGSASSTPGVRETLCFTGSGIRRVQFSGAGDRFARFDNFRVDFTTPPIIIE
jgi:hypothetical protein